MRVVLDQLTQRRKSHVGVACPTQALAGAAQRGVDAQLLLAKLVAQQSRERAHALDRLARLVHELGRIRRARTRPVRRAQLGRFQ